MPQGRKPQSRPEANAPVSARQTTGAGANLRLSAIGDANRSTSSERGREAGHRESDPAERDRGRPAHDEIRHRVIEGPIEGRSDPAKNHTARDIHQHASRLRGQEAYAPVPPSPRPGRKRTSGSRRWRRTCPHSAGCSPVPSAARPETSGYRAPCAGDLLWRQQRPSLVPIGSARNRPRAPWDIGPHSASGRRHHRRQRAMRCAG